MSHKTAVIVAAGAGICLLTAGSAARADCPTGTQILVDNDIPGSGYSETSPHNWASRPVGACHVTYRYLSHDVAVAPNNDGTRTGKAIWQPAITIAGYYEIVTSYRATTNRTNDADYFVYDDLGGVTHTVVDQSHDGDCTYHSLGTHYCAAGGQCRVELDGTDDSQSDAADITSFTLVSCDEPLPPAGCDGIVNHPAYELCVSTATSCAGVFTNGDGCLAYCAAAGMACVASYGGEPGCQQELQNPLACDAVTGHQSDWCECELPPGTGGSGGGGGGSATGGSAAGGSGGAPPSGGSGGTGLTSAGGSGGAGGPGGAAGTEPGEEAGCGCRAGATPRSPRWLLAALALFALARRRRPPEAEAFGSAWGGDTSPPLTRR